MIPTNQSQHRTDSKKNAPIQVEARSVEQALVKAAGLLGVTQDEIEFQVVKEDAPKGLFSFFKTPSVIISATTKKASGIKTPPDRRTTSTKPNNEFQKEFRSKPLESPGKSYSRRDENDDDSSHDDSREALSPEKVAALTGELQDFCAGIIQRISGEDPKVSARVEDGRLILSSDNEYLGQQITRNTKLAEAMEHILRKKPRHLRQELPFRIFIDVGGMRRKREDELIQMALDLSIKVHENRRPIVLNYKSSYDRKIIHMALDKDDRVYTKSIGSGPNRKLMILPNKYNPNEGEGAFKAPQEIDVD